MRQGGATGASWGKGVVMAGVGDAVYVISGGAFWRIAEHQDFAVFLGGGAINPILFLVVLHEKSRHEVGRIIPGGDDYFEVHFLPFQNVLNHA